MHTGSVCVQTQIKKIIFDSEVIFHVLFLLGTEESTITLTITPVWDLIETCGFCMDDSCDFPDTSILPHKKFTKPNITQSLKNDDFWQYLLISQLSKFPLTIL